MVSLHRVYSDVSRTSAEILRSKCQLASQLIVQGFHLPPVLTTTKPIDGRKISLAVLLEETNEQNCECWLNLCWSVMNLVMIAWREERFYHMALYVLTRCRSKKYWSALYLNWSSLRASSSLYTNFKKIDQRNISTRSWFDWEQNRYKMLSQGVTSRWLTLLSLSSRECCSFHTQANSVLWESIDLS